MNPKGPRKARKSRRSKAKTERLFTSASECKVTRPDGTAFTVPALRPGQRRRKVAPG